MPLETGVPKVSVAPAELVAIAVNVRVVPTGAVCGDTVTEVMEIESSAADVENVELAPSASVTVPVIVIVVGISFSF